MTQNNYKTIILDGIEYKLVPSCEIKFELSKENLVKHKAKKEFKPFELNIKVNTLADLKSLWNRFVIDNDDIYKITNKYFKVKESECNEFYGTWDYLDDILNELGVKKELYDK